jgi:Tfp pilus assembly protein PilX
MKNKVPYLKNNVSTEEGFAIPIALGFGFIMLLLATTAILRSHDGTTAAVNKRATAQSLAAAEAGVTKVQNFLNNNRDAISYQACVTWPTSGLGACTDSTANTSWKNISNLCSTTDATSMATNAWRSVDTTDLSRGEYKLDGYTSAGVVSIQGRVNGGQISEAVSSLQVQFPITQVDQEQAASLWVKTSVTGSPQVDSDVIGPCNTSNTMTATFPTGSDRQNFRTGATIPTAPAKPTTNIRTLTSLSGKTLPETGDTAYDPTPSDTTNGDAVYQYSVPAIASGDHFRVASGSRVAIWVAGSINLTNTVVANQCGSLTTCGPFDVTIYGTLPTGGTLALNEGSVVCDVFFHMPNYNVTFTSGGTPPTVSGTAANCGAAGLKNTAIYWVNSWSSGVSGTTVINPARDKWGANSPITNYPMPPRIGPSIKWDPQAS